MKGRKYKSLKFKAKLNKRKNKKNNTKKKGGANVIRTNSNGTNSNGTNSNAYLNEKNLVEMSNDSETINRLKEFGPTKKKGLLLRAAGVGDDPIKQEKFGKNFEMGIKGGGSILVIGLIGGLVAILASQ